jgi:hypothetical protein
MFRHCDYDTPIVNVTGIMGDNGVLNSSTAM